MLGFQGGFKRDKIEKCLLKKKEKEKKERKKKKRRKKEKKDKIDKLCILLVTNSNTSLKEEKMGKKLNAPL